MAHFPFNTGFNPRTHAGCDQIQRAALDGVVVSIHAPTQGATFLSPNFDKPVKFQSTHPRRVRARARQIASFNPRTHAGCAPDSARACTRGCFNPRTHAGCDWRHSRCVWHWAVSIHAPTQGATRYLRDKRPKLVFQSTHPRRVRPSATTDDVVVFQVSIHAPTQGATDGSQRLGRQDISIHAPTQGATVGGQHLQSPEGFNPRTHAGCDARAGEQPRMAAFQSTHPRRVRPIGSSSISFQSTHPRRVRGGWRGWHLIESFQSTHPRRVRREWVSLRWFARFNPRTHAGCATSVPEALIECFNPRTHAGCDVTWALPGLQRLDCFNPRTHAGCDNIAEWTQKVHADFNPRTHAGCDIGRVAIAAVAFQSTHPRRVRLEGFPLLYAIEGVSIHAPTQGATISRSYSVLNLLFQSTHPRRVRHFRVVPESLAQFQSTHPRRVRRLLGGRQVRVHRVSIHAPTQGATSSTCGSHRSESSFNPRTHAGCDSAVRPVFRVGDVVSIHAPTQGATLRR